jgi:hypothetical protein
MVFFISCNLIYFFSNLTQRKHTAQLILYYSLFLMLYIVPIVQLINIHIILLLN